MKKTFLFLSIVIISFSCIRDVDLDQVETASFSTPVDLALLQLDLLPIDFLDANNNEKVKIQKTYLIDLSEFFYDSSTDSIQYVTNFSNTFNRDFECYYEFIGPDANSRPLITTAPVLVPAVSSSEIQSLVFEDETFVLFKQARWIKVRVRLLNGLPFSPNDDLSLSMQSVIHFDYEIEP